MTNQVCKDIYCSIDSANTKTPASFPLKLGQWVNIPLTGGSCKYQLTVTPSPTAGEQTYPSFNVAFSATIKDPDAWTLLSNANVDFENAPKTVAKAAELTKNCKTDAEKITAIFEFAAKTIKYDSKITTDSTLFKDYDLDKTLDRKTGICAHYATLMAGMLRSQGISCKVISGEAYQTQTGWDKHAWVSVSPDTNGLNMSQLGAGHDEDGWIRLDPTWASTGGTFGRSQAAIDKNHKTLYAH